MVRGDQGCAGIKAKLRTGRHQRIVRETFVPRRIRNNEQRALRDGVSTKGEFARRFLDPHAHFRLEPLTALINQHEERDGRLTDVGSQHGNAVESLLRRRIQDIVAVERSQALLFIPEDGNRVRRGSFPINGQGIPFRWSSFWSFHAGWLPAQAVGRITVAFGRGRRTPQSISRWRAGACAPLPSAGGAWRCPPRTPGTLTAFASRTLGLRVPVRRTGETGPAREADSSARRLGMGTAR